MSFIETTSPDEAAGKLAEIYKAEESAMGYVPNYTRAFSLRPDMFVVWTELIKTARSAMDARRYEIATVGAAIALESSYCTLAHGEKLLELGSDEAEVRSLVTDGSALDEQEQTILEYAAKVARSAASVTEKDIEGLRLVGLNDTEIFDVAAVAAARCFFSKLLDATGTRPDAVFRERLPALVDALTVGRAPEEAP